VSTLGDSAPLASADASTDADWKQWALAVFGGNEARATAAAQAAAAARRAGATSDALFAAARAAYDTAGSPSWTDVSLPPAGSGGATADCVVRPSGRGILGVSLVVILVAGIGSVIVRSGTGSVVPVVGAAAVIMGVWFALSLRSNVRVSGPTVSVQGVLHRREFPRLGVRQITVQPRARQLGLVNSPLRGQFLASFVGDDFAHLFELRQGAWTRTDIDRIGSAIGVQVIDDSAPSIT
jgi:hypothetical protein